MKFARGLAVAIVLLFSVFACGQASRPVDPAKITKLVSLLQENHYDYHTTRSPSVFTIHFVGEHIKDIKLILAIGDDPDADLIVFVTVTEKRHMPVTTDFMRLLLEQNHVMDQTKIGYDKDGDLEVRIDGSMRLADATYLRHIVEQVKNVSDELYGVIEPSLN